ncbi:ribosome binding protein, putative [Babesia ovata]|uniref:Ribosome binding protein, putative n=1 Tax=Babesia ovata TaxID=189622 RepID=A0A2H6KD51_9APIC|nr:ribosome binding protein, putative [Babesia ovata]GBE60926.1 ribosome binding protein, putative [Babesia ovata]
MAPHGVPLGSLKECLQFLEWLKRYEAMQDKVARELHGRIKQYFQESKDIFNLENVKLGLTAFLGHVSAFYTRKNPNDIVDALLECLSKFLAAIYFLEYCVYHSYERLGGGGWKQNWPAWNDSRWGGHLGKYLYADSGDETHGVIPGGFTYGDVSYYTLGRSYYQGSYMVFDLQKILSKQNYNFFRSVFVTSVIGDAANRKENAANALSLIRTFCDIVGEADPATGGSLIRALDAGLKEHVKSDQTICWKELREHCAQLRIKFDRFSKRDERFDFTGQATGTKKLKKEELAKATADWIRTYLNIVRRNLVNINTDASATKHLGDYFTKHFFPYGFTFNGEARFRIRGNKLNGLKQDWREVIEEFRRDGDGDLERLKEILNGKNKTLCPVDEPPKEIVPEKKVAVPKKPEVPPAKVPGSEPAMTVPTKTEAAKPVVTKAEAAKPTATKTEGNQNQGKKAEGAQNQGKKSEGAQNQGKKGEGTPTPLSPNQNNGQSESKSPPLSDVKALASAPSPGTSGGQVPPGPTGPVDLASSSTQDTSSNQGVKVQTPSQPPHQLPPGPPSPPPTPPQVPAITQRPNVSGPGPGSTVDQGIGQDADQDASQQITLQTSQGSGHDSSSVTPTSVTTAAGGGGSGKAASVVKQTCSDDQLPAIDLSGKDICRPKSTTYHRKSLSSDLLKKLSDIVPQNEYTQAPKKSKPVQTQIPPPLSSQPSRPDSGDYSQPTGGRPRHGKPYYVPGEGRPGQGSQNVQRDIPINLLLDVDGAVVKDNPNTKLQKQKDRIAVFHNAYENSIRLQSDRNREEDGRLQDQLEQKQKQAEANWSIKKEHGNRIKKHNDDVYRIQKTLETGRIRLSQKKEAMQRTMDAERKRQEALEQATKLRNFQEGIKIDTKVLNQHPERPTYPGAARVEAKRSGWSQFIPVKIQVPDPTPDDPIGNGILGGRGLQDSTFPPVSSHIGVPMGYPLKHKAPQWHDPPPPSKPVAQMYHALPEGVVLSHNEQRPKRVLTSRATVHSPMQAQEVEIDPALIVLNVTGKTLDGHPKDGAEIFPTPLTLDATPVPDHRDKKHSVDIYEHVVVKHDLPLTDILPQKRPPPIPAVPKNAFHTPAPFHSEISKPPHSITLFPGDPPSVTQDDMSCMAPWMLQQPGPSKNGHNDLSPYPPDAQLTILQPSKVTPRTVREMLYWIAGLRHSAFYNGLEKYIAHSIKNLTEDAAASSSDMDTLQLAAFPDPILVKNVTKALRLSCQYSVIALMGIQGLNDPGTAYMSGHYKTIPQFEYSADPARLLCQLRDYVYACYHQLTFLKVQCSREQSHGGWKDCQYGNNVPKSPLQAFLTDAADSKFKTDPFDPRDICRKSRVNMGFTKEDLPATHETGNVLLTILSPTCGGDDPLLTLSSYLTCLTRRTPRTTGELVSFFHNFGNELHKLPPQLSPLGSALSQPHDNCPDWDHLEADDLKVIKDARGSGPPTAIHDKDHAKTLSTLLGCDITNAQCPQLMKPITYRAYALYSSSFVHHYLSWVVHLTDRLWESLTKLHCDFEKLQCPGSKPLHQCPEALPLLYSHGFTPPEGTSKPSLTCSELVAKLEQVANGQPIAKLMTAMDLFLYRIRAPFLYTVFTLWLTATLYIVHALLFRLDVLRIRSHLLSSKASHLIDVKALLTKGRKMLSLYRDVDYFDDPVGWIGL